MDNYFEENIKWINEGSDRLLNDLNGNFTYLTYRELADKYYKGMKGVARWAIQQLEQEDKIDIKKYEQVHTKERTSNAYRLKYAPKLLRFGLINDDSDTRLVRYEDKWLTITSKHKRLFKESIRIVKAMGMKPTKKAVMEEFGAGDIFEFLWEKYLTNKNKNK